MNLGLQDMRWSIELINLWDKIFKNCSAKRSLQKKFWKKKISVVRKRIMEKIKIVLWKKQSFEKKFWAKREIVLGGKFLSESLMDYISFFMMWSLHLGFRFLPLLINWFSGFSVSEPSFQIVKLYEWTNISCAPTK